jgi:hypothetical protein
LADGRGPKNDRSAAETDRVRLLVDGGGLNRMNSRDDRRRRQEERRRAAAERLFSGPPPRPTRGNGMPDPPRPKATARRRGRNIGSAVGATVGVVPALLFCTAVMIPEAGEGQLGCVLAIPVGALIGLPVGAGVGSLIGSLVGKRQPQPPTAERPDSQ